MLRELRERTLICKRFNRLPIEHLKYIRDELARIISNRESGEKDRLYNYARFQQDIERAKAIFASLDSMALRELENICRELKSQRAELTKIFSSPEIHLICQKCKGECCGGGFDLMSAAYLAFSNLTLPEPTMYSSPFEVRPYDGYYYCPFLSKKGCILGENKPFICLRHTCYKLKERMNGKAYRDKVILLDASLQKFQNILRQKNFFQS